MDRYSKEIHHVLSQTFLNKVLGLVLLVSTSLLLDLQSLQASQTLA